MSCTQKCCLLILFSRNLLKYPHTWEAPSGSWDVGISLKANGRLERATRIPGPELVGGTKRAPGEQYWANTLAGGEEKAKVTSTPQSEASTQPCPLDPLSSSPSSQLGFERQRRTG